MQIRMIGIDLDDTYLDANKTIPQENITAVERALSQGVMVLPVTGRPFHAIPKDVLTSAPFRYCIASGGAAAYDLATEEVLFRELMPQQVARTMVPLLQAEHFVVNVFVDGTGYVNEAEHELSSNYGWTAAFRDYFRKYRTPVPDVMDVIASHPDGMEKITASGPRGEDGHMVGVERAIAIAHQFSEDVCVMYSPGINVEINGIRATKGRAMRRLGERFGITKEEIMAIGDSANDVEMLKGAAVSVAVGNAAPEVKEIAMYTVANSECAGVAEAIDRFALAKNRSV